MPLQQDAKSLIVLFVTLRLVFQILTAILQNVCSTYLERTERV